MSLVRLRADPSKIHVRIRRYGNHYAVTVVSVHSRFAYTQHGTSPVVTVLRALLKAYRAHVPGVDPYCEWAYEHPQSRRRERLREWERKVRRKVVRGERGRRA